MGKRIFVASKEYKFSEYDREDAWRNMVIKAIASAHNV